MAPLSALAQLAHPTIQVGAQDLPATAEAAWAALKQMNEPPFIFVRAGVPVRVIPTEGGGVEVQPLTPDSVRHVIARAADWVNGKGDPAHPPLPVVRDMLAYAEPPLPRLTRVVATPVYVPGPRLLDTLGYDAETGIYLAQPQCQQGLRVPRNPTAAQIARALSLLTEELLADFPFKARSDRAHAIALLLLPYVRALILGPTPLHSVEKPTPRTGGSLLVEVLLTPATGAPVPVVTLGTSEDETRRMLTAQLLSSPTAIVIDNVNVLHSPALAGAITTMTWVDRLVGTSRDVRLPVTCAWVTTGNNPRLSTELLGRTARIRLDAGLARPEDRTDFRHPRLREWANQNRQRIVWSALVLCQAWVAAGCPEGSATLGGFENWSRIVGGILDVAGLPGFLENRDELYIASDSEGNAGREFVRAWAAGFGTRAVGVAELFALVSGDEPIALDLGDGSPRSQQTRLGHWLSSARDKVFDGHKVVAAGDRQRARLWRLVPAASAVPASVDEPAVNVG